MVIAVQEEPEGATQMINLDSYLCGVSSFQATDPEPERVAVLFHVDEQTQYIQPTSCLAIKNKACGDCEREGEIE